MTAMQIKLSPWEIEGLLAMDTRWHVYYDTPADQRVQAASKKLTADAFSKMFG